MREKVGATAPRAVLSQAPKAHYFWHRARHGTSPSDWRTRDCSIHFTCLLVAFFLASCVSTDSQHRIVISTREQKLAVLERGNLLAVYPVSTSKFGLGDQLGSYDTPLGRLEIA